MKLMRDPLRLLTATIIVGSLAVGSAGQLLVAQPAPTPTPVVAPTPATPEVVAPVIAPPVVAPIVAEKAKPTMGLTQREIAQRAAQYTSEMQKMLRRILQLQAQARKDKDVIKLNCVNDRLVVAKQLLNLADIATIALTEATEAKDVAEQEHQLGQLQISHEKVAGQRDDAETCLGEEIVFVGPNAVSITGLKSDNNPTDDDDLTVDNSSSTDHTRLEQTVYASPFAPL